MLHKYCGTSVAFVARSVNELARAAMDEAGPCRSPLCHRDRGFNRGIVIAHGAFIWLVAGTLLLGIVAHVAVPPATWLALTFLLHATRALPAGLGFLCSWAAIYAGLSVGLRGILPLSGPGYFAIVGFYTTTLTLPFTIDRVAAPRIGGIASTLIFPLALAAAEFLRARFAPPATWGSLAYTQYGYLPLMQVAAFVGIWGITFLVAWSASTAEWVWSRGFEWSVVRTPVLTWAGVLAAVVFGGTLRLVLAPTDRPSLRVATLNRPVDLFVPGEMTRIAEGRLSIDEQKRLGDKLARLHDWFLDGSRREARAGARLIAFPEQNLLIFEADEPAFLERARRLAADERVYLAIGMGTVHIGAALPFENKLVLIDPKGAIIASYLKTHAVVGWEASIMRPGDGHLPVVATADGRMAGAICFDADFPELIRQAGQGLADLLIVPANEWKATKEVHPQMAAFRAIENGVSLVRPAASGISSAFDPWGRVLGVADYFAPGDRTLTVQVPVGGIRTLYARTGDLFAWLCVAGLVAALGFAAIHRGTADGSNHSNTRRSLALSPGPRFTE
jgi:apolipoprotein N-acyltransferase